MLAHYQVHQGLFVKGFAGRCHCTIRVPLGEEMQYEAHVADAPSVHDAAIASADVLQRDQDMFAEMLNTHQQIRAAEMEAGGFVKGCQDGKSSRPWLVVRGISDFGDLFKNDNFHHLAAHSAAAYTADFLKRGADIDLADPKGARRRAAAALVAMVATGVDAQVDSSLAGMQGDSATVEYGAAIGKNSPPDVDDLEGTFNRLRQAWCELPSRETLRQLQALCSAPTWLHSSSRSQAEMLRFMAYASFATDKERATEISRQADSLASPRPDDSAHLRWVLETQGPEALLAILADVSRTDLWNLRLVSLQRLHRHADLAVEFEQPPKGVTPDAESLRVYAWALLEIGRFDEALTSANEASTKQPKLLGNRVVEAVAKYFSTIVPDYARRLRRDVPVATDKAFLRVDAGALVTLREAEETFQDLIRSELANTELTESLEGWRLACLCNDPERQTEAREFCRVLLGRQPPHPCAIPWAMARGYEPELDALSPPPINLKHEQ
jgi:hypothetical protein